MLVCLYTGSMETGVCSSGRRQAPFRLLHRLILFLFFLHETRLAPPPPQMLICLHHHEKTRSPPPPKKKTNNNKCFQDMIASLSAGQVYGRAGKCVG